MLPAYATSVTLEAAASAARLTVPDAVLGASSTAATSSRVAVADAVDARARDPAVVPTQEEALAIRLAKARLGPLGAYLDAGPLGRATAGATRPTRALDPHASVSKA